MHLPKFTRAEQAGHLQILTQQLRDALRHHEQEIDKLRKTIRIAEKSIRILTRDEGETFVSVSTSEEGSVHSSPTSHHSPSLEDATDDSPPIADIFTKSSRSQLSLLTSPPPTPSQNLNTLVKNNIASASNLQLSVYEFKTKYGVQQLTSPPTIGQTIVVMKAYRSTTDNLQQERCLGIVTSFASMRNKSRVNIRLGKDRTYVKQWSSLGTLTKNLSSIPSRFT